MVIIDIIIIGEATMLTFKVTTVGASAGVILTKEALARLKVQKGDTVYLTEAPDGGFRLTPYDPDFARQMAVAEDIMHEDRDILRALAK
jgi:putative addiction module antidote